MKADTGPCRAAIPRFFFDSDSGNCQRFIYGGCDGNDNRFDTLEECETTSKSIGCKPWFFIMSHFTSTSLKIQIYSLLLKMCQWFFGIKCNKFYESCNNHT